MARTPEEQRNLDFVLEMYHQVLMPMDSSRVDHYISPDYIQHSSMAPPGREPLKHFLDKIRKESPDARQYIKRTLVDGDHVAVHLHVVRHAGDPGLAVVDMFRTDGRMILEHWEVIMDVPARPINTNSMF
jgi:predicted SnoaL-like aldol condensation-catalyzing enzyme